MRNIAQSLVMALMLLMVPAIGLWAVYLQHGGWPW